MEAVVENRYPALVRGPSAVFPRGYLWLIPLWALVLLGLAYDKGQLPSWYEVCCIGPALLAVLIVFAVLATLRNNAFVADESGILLGLRGAAQRRIGRRRRQKHLAWYEVSQLKIAYRPYGARLDIFMAVGSATGNGRAVWRIIAATVTVLLPPACVFRSPGLLRPRSGPVRYRVPLYDVRPEELQLALAPFTPPNVAIVVRPRLRARALARLRRLRRSRLTTAA
ncbi:MAG: hypothetical protein WB800_25885 [Streptosporangiaceae bacterium]